MLQHPFFACLLAIAIFIPVASAELVLGTPEKIGIIVAATVGQSPFYFFAAC